MFRNSYRAWLLSRTSQGKSQLPSQIAHSRILAMFRAKATKARFPFHCMKTERSRSVTHAHISAHLIPHKRCLEDEAKIMVLHRTKSASMALRYRNCMCRRNWSSHRRKRCGQLGLAGACDGPDIRVGMQRSKHECSRAAVQKHAKHESEAS